MKKLISNKVTPLMANACISSTCLFLRAKQTFCDDVFSIAEAATGQLQTKFISLATKIFPVALLISILAMFFTRDRKALKVEMGVALGLCVAYILLLLVKNGVIVNTLQSLTGLAG